MLRSKATAALMRLKEIDRKYNIKSNESKRFQSNISSVSSLDDTPRDLHSNSKVSSNKPDIAQIALTTDSAFSPRKKGSPRSKVDMKLQSSFVTRNDDDLSSNDMPNLRKSPTNSPKISMKTSENEDDRYSEMEEETVSKTKKPSRTPSSLQSDSNTKEKFKTSKDSSRKSDESSVATILSQSSGVSEIISKAGRSVEESSLRRNDGKSKVPEATSAENDIQEDESVLNETDAGNYETSIDEVTKISDEKSEIISELFPASEKDVLTERRSPDFSRQEQKLQYDSDTFEEASSSTASLSSTVQRFRKSSDEEAIQNTIRSGVKEITIIPHKQIESVQEAVTDDRDIEIIELVAPKVMQSTSECDVGLDAELSNYVRTTENVDDPQEVLPINLLKISKPTTPTKRHVRKSKRHRQSSNENTEETQTNTEFAEASYQKKLTRRTNNKSDDNVSEKNCSSTMMRSVEQKNNEEDSLSGTHSKVEPIEVDGGSSKHEIGDGDLENISSDKILREIPKKSDVTSTLRKLNKDAIDAIARRRRFHSTRETLDKPGQCRKCGTIVKLPFPESETLKKIEADENRATSLENVRLFKDSRQDQRIRGKRTKVKRVCKTSRVRKVSNCGEVEEKHSRFDYRQMHRLQKRAATLRLQQERQDIRNYLLELESTRIEFGLGESIIPCELPAFKPLEFPKIGAFIKPGLEDVDFECKDKALELQERILMMKQWLKDQYILYRNYSSLAQTVNAKYTPTSLEDAKKTIRQLQKATS